MKIHIVFECSIFHLKIENTPQSWDITISCNTLSYDLLLKYHHWKSMEILCCSEPNSNKSDHYKVLTRQMCAIMAWANRCSDVFIYNRITTIHTFHRIWIMIKIIINMMVLWFRNHASSRYTIHFLTDCWIEKACEIPAHNSRIVAIHHFLHNDSWIMIKSGQWQSTPASQFTHYS